jgi:hypothetical protein
VLEGISRPSSHMRHMAGLLNERTRKTTSNQQPRMTCFLATGRFSEGGESHHQTIITDTSTLTIERGTSGGKHPMFPSRRLISRTMR